MPVDFATIESIVTQASQEGRTALYEHEVYELIHASGAVRVPQTVFRSHGKPFVADDLERFPGAQVVVKIVSPDLAHKSDLGGVRFLPRDVDAINATADEFAEIAAGQNATFAGTVVCEYMPHSEASLGNELFVGIRASREFGPIIAAGLGGVHTEYLASVTQRGKSIATALTEQTNGVHMFRLFQKTMAYDILAGRARGYKRIIEDENLIECFQAFIDVAHHFCANSRANLPLIADLEVNPFALNEGFMVPLDGLCHLKKAAEELPPRPIGKIDHLLHPKSMAVIGVSTKGMNMGRVILNNVLQCGFDKSNLFVIKPGSSDVDGVKCVDSISDLPQPVDLLVVAVAAPQVPDIANEVIDSDKVQSVILIPGGNG